MQRNINPETISAFLSFITPLKKCKVVLVHVKKAQREAEVKVHSFLTLGSRLRIVVNFMLRPP